MINKFTVENFKCFQKQEFELNRLNVFTGYNGRGKSSVIQALLMLSQSIERYADIRTLSVNGNFINLDLFSDLLFCKGKNICFSIINTEESIKDIKLEYKQDKMNDRAGKLCALYINGKNFSNIAKALNSDSGEKESKDKKPQFDKYDVGAIQKTFDNFYYISADRLGPTRFEEKKELDILNPVGINGQSKLNILQKTDGILKKVENDIQYIMDTDNKLELSSDSASVIELYFVNADGKKIKAINTGFGYSYILSIVLLLDYVESGVIFIENPEAHLHPLAQSRLMELICKKLDENKDLQIYIETHSEHIINAVRLCSVKDEIKLQNNDVSLYFFNKDFSVEKLEINTKGQILHWPEGFFDQQTKDLSEIIKHGFKN